MGRLGCRTTAFQPCHEWVLHNCVCETRLGTPCAKDLARAGAAWCRASCCATGGTARLPPPSRLQDKQLMEVLADAGNVVTLTIIPAVIYEHMVKR